MADLTTSLKASQRFLIQSTYGRDVLVLIAIGLGLLVIFTLSVGFGSSFIPADRVLKTLVGLGERMDSVIVLKLRLPRVLLALEAGICLAIAGYLLQAATRNPLASPAILGIVDGSALGIAVFMFIFVNEANILTVSIQWQPLAAALGAIGFAVLVALLTLRDNRGPMQMVIYGVALAALASAGVTLFLVAGENFYATKALTWIAGSVHAAKWSSVTQVGLMMCVLLVFLPFLLRPIEQMQIDNQSAFSTGLSVDFELIKILVLAVLFTATAVSFAGGIAFVGLVAPHAARLLFKGRVAYSLIACAFLGGAIVVSADLAARLLFQPTEVPTGTLTAVLGAPYFFWLLFKRSKNHA